MAQSPKRTTIRYIVVDGRLGMDIVIHDNEESAKTDCKLYPNTYIIVETTTEWENVKTISRE